MEYRTLGISGVKVSPLCLGTMNFGGPTPEDESIRLIHHAMDAGINFIDTANVYNEGESERVVGKALKNGRRDNVVLATKVFMRMGDGPNDWNASRFHIIKACEDSLRRLDTDHIDLYQLHRVSPDIAQEEALRALDDLVTAGKIRYIGASTYPAWKVMEGLALSERYGWARYTSEQPPYNLLDRRIENELIPLAQQYNIAILPWSPLAMGMLAGRYPLGEAPPADSRLAAQRNFVQTRVNDAGRRIGAKVVELAQERGMSAAQFATLWCKDQPGVTAPVIGPRTMTHLNEALAVLDMTLTDEDRAACDELVHPGTAVADFHNTAGWMKAQIFDS